MMRVRELAGLTLSLVGLSCCGGEEAHQSKLPVVVPGPTIKSLQAYIKQLQMERSHLITQQVNQQITSDNLKKSCRDLQDSNTRLSFSLEIVKSQLKSPTEEHKATTMNQSIGTPNQKHQLRVRIPRHVELEGEISKLKTRNSMLAKSKDELEKLSRQKLDQIGHLTEQIKQLSETNNGLTNNNGKLVAQLRASKHLLKRNKKLTVKLHKKRRRKRNKGRQTRHGR